MFSLNNTAKWMATAVISLMLGLGSQAARAADDLPINRPSDNRPFIYADSIPFGVYDPPGSFTNDRFPRIEHLFLPWEDVDLAFLYEADAYARARGREILITIEPWTWSQERRIVPDDLYDNIMNGNFNATIAQICGIAGTYKSKTTVRWAQEMEDPVGRFSWQYWRPQSFKKAYRKFVEQCRAAAPNLAFMWSPKGLPNLADFYPGDDVVDIVGLSVFGYQPHDRGEYGHDRTFEEILTPGYAEAIKIGKPIWVAELGYSGDRIYVADWQKSVERRYRQFPELKAIVYFNDKEVWPWMKNYGLPDWRVDSNVIAGSISQVAPQ